MKRMMSFMGITTILLGLLFVMMAGSCKSYMKMNPPADSDKPLPVPAGDNSCWMHAASNMLAGAGYGTGTTLQARADNIFSEMDTHYGTANGGWIDAALQWWLASPNNTWTTNPYTVVTVYGNKTKVPWANTNGAMDIGNYLRICDLVGVSISWPATSGAYGGHAITAWGDNIDNTAQLTANPNQIRVTDSDTDNGGNVQVYTYDNYTNPNPGGANAGNGWYFSYGTPHPFIKHIVTLSRATTPGTNSVLVAGSYQIHQKSEVSATDLHYRVGTDVDILSYRTWLDWENGTPNITEAQPRRELTVDWDFTKKVPQCTWITINTEFVESSWNSISYHDVHFTYPDGKVVKLPDLKWKMETPEIPKADMIPNVTGGYVIGSFDIYDTAANEEPVVRYRFVHQYLYNQSPETHTLFISGTPGYMIKNVRFSQSYGNPTLEKLWRSDEKWMTYAKDTTRVLGEQPLKIEIDWKGKLPYPEGDRGVR